jgi:L-fuculose-phosphate aldolase
MPFPDLGISLQKLAQSHRILAAAGQGDGTLGHVSLRDPLQRGFWLKRAEIGMDEVRAETDFLLLSFAGEILAGQGERHSEWPLHAELLQARVSLQAVVHTHSPSASLLSATSATVLPFTTSGGYFASNPIRNFRAQGAHIDDAAAAQALVAFLGEARAALIRNHGLVACGTSVAQATLVSLFLDRAAAVQLATLIAPSAFQAATATEMAGREAMLSSATFLEQNFAYYARSADRTGRIQP